MKVAITPKATTTSGSTPRRQARDDTDAAITLSTRSAKPVSHSTKATSEAPRAQRRLRRDVDGAQRTPTGEQRVNEVPEGCRRDDAHRRRQIASEVPTCQVVATIEAPQIEEIERRLRARASATGDRSAAFIAGRVRPRSPARTHAVAVVFV
jgi:hypothetical protein